MYELQLGDKKSFLKSRDVQDWVVKNIFVYVYDMCMYLELACGLVCTGGSDCLLCCSLNSKVTGSDFILMTLGCSAGGFAGMVTNDLFVCRLSQPDFDLHVRKATPEGVLVSLKELLSEGMTF